MKNFKMLGIIKNELNFEYKGVKCCIALHKGLYTAHIAGYRTLSKVVYKNIGSSKSQIEALQIIKRQVGQNEKSI